MTIPVNMPFSRVRKVVDRSIPTVTGNRGGAETNIRKCILEDSTRYMRVIKTYEKGSMNLFHGAVQATCTSRFNPVLASIVPHVTHFDYRHLTMYMALIDGVTLEEYLGKICSFQNQTSVLFEQLISKIESVLTSLEEMGLSHQDLHCGNVMVSRRGSDITIHLIDIDELSPIESPSERYDDRTHLVSCMKYDIVDTMEKSTKIKNYTRENTDKFDLAQQPGTSKSSLKIARKIHDNQLIQINRIVQHVAKFYIDMMNDSLGSRTR